MIFFFSGQNGIMFNFKFRSPFKTSRKLTKTKHEIVLFRHLNRKGKFYKTSGEF